MTGAAVSKGRMNIKLDVNKEFNEKLYVILKTLNVSNFNYAKLAADIGEIFYIYPIVERTYVKECLNAFMMLVALISELNTKVLDGFGYIYDDALDKIMSKYLLYDQEIEGRSM